MFAENGIQQCRCHIVSISIRAFYFRIFFIRIDTKADIRRKCPWCGCPCENVSIFVFHFETDDCRTLFYILISLRYLLCGKRSTAAWAVRYDFKSFVQKAFFPDLFQCPPLRFNEIVVVSYIWVIHISPETNGAGEILPHSFVFPYTFFTLIDKWLQPIFLNLVFAIQSEKLLHFQLNRKSMCIPARFTRHFVAFHCAVSRDHIFDHTCQYMSDMRLSIGCRRSVIKSIFRTSLAVFHTFFEDIMFFPELFYLLFSFHKIQIGIYFLIHVCFLLLLNS